MWLLLLCLVGRTTSGTVASNLLTRKQVMSETHKFESLTARERAAHCEAEYGDLKAAILDNLSPWLKSGISLKVRCAQWNPNAEPHRHAQGTATRLPKHSA